jgi:hypothetical protein
VKTGSRTVLAGAWLLAFHSAGAQSAYGAGEVLPAYFDQLIAPSQILLSPAPRADDAQLSLLKNIQADDLRITGFVASREGVAAPDYRVYLGVGYKTQLGSTSQMTSRAFYGTGTFDGVDPHAAALPQDVLSGGSLPGEWLGADWKVESHLFSRHALSAGVEYRQELADDVLALDTFMGRSSLADATAPERRIGFVTKDSVTLAQNLALNVRMRYEDAPGTAAMPAASSVAPRAELVYRPEQASTVSAAFDQSGFEVGMERSGFGGMRSRVSYAWQEATDALAGTATGNLGQRLTRASVDIPILPQRLSTSFEVQYIDLVGSLVGDHNRDYVISNVTLASGSVSRDTSVTFGMHNLFGVKDPGSAAQILSFIPPDGRSVRLDFKHTL